MGDPDFPFGVRRVFVAGHRGIAGSATLAPSLEVGLRHDGGDAGTGNGLEAGAALRYADYARSVVVYWRTESSKIRSKKAMA